MTWAPASRRERLPGGTVPAPQHVTLDQRTADLEFQVRRLQVSVASLEKALEGALSDIAALKRPRDVRYVPRVLRGRS